MTKEQREFLKQHYYKMGKKGGTRTVEKYGLLKMSEWGKKGGWPKGRKRKPEKIEAKTLDKATR